MFKEYTALVDDQNRPMFDTGSAVVKPYMRDLLHAIGGVLVEVPNRLTLEGHTDSIASDDYNRGLSERRAAAVKEYLVSKGIPANRVYTEGKGEKQPVKDCPAIKDRKKLIECLQPNRRVEVEVVGSRAKK